MKTVHNVLISTVALIIIGLATTNQTTAADFEYDSPGKLIPGSGQGREDSKVYLPGMRFPFESSPAYANSQVYRPGGYQGGGGRQCDSSNYSYPWQDNFCETRGWSMPFCPTGKGHQGQDIRPATCEKNVHWAVAVEQGTITNIGSYSITLQGNSGIRHRYLHLNHNNLAVKVGGVVNKGQRIGLISNNFGGTPTTIHLHYDMYSGGRYIPTYMSLVKSYESLLRNDPTTPPPVSQNAFKKAVTAKPADFDGDGFDDIFWYRYNNDTDYTWFGNNRAFDSVSQKAGGEFTPITGDYNGDGLTDIFWYRSGSDFDYIWFSEGRTFRAERTQIQGNYLPISGDFDGNGVDDIFWYRPGTGQDVVFYGSNSGKFESIKATVNDTYVPVAGNFSGNGIDNIFWYQAGSGQEYIWGGRGTTFATSPIQIAGTYDPIAGDYNGDGMADIFWYAAGSAADYISYSTGSDFQYAPKNAVPIYGTYTPIKGDFNGDVYSDIFWYKPGTGTDYIYYGTALDTFEVSSKFPVTAEFVAIP